MFNRLLAFQKGQQDSIDRAKGIIARPLPKSWNDFKSCKDAEEQSICADRKPYFMIYVYPALQTEYKRFVDNCNRNLTIRFAHLGIRSIDDLRQYEPKTEEMREFVEWYDKKMPVGLASCTINKICWLIESVFKDVAKKIDAVPFDAGILKSGVSYSKGKYNAIAKIYADYLDRVKSFMAKSKAEKLDKDSCQSEKQTLIDDFVYRCSLVCPNEKELCDILIDLCYTSNSAKSFVWDICGDIIIDNLLSKNDGKISYPAKAETDAEFEFNGVPFRMVSVDVNKNEVVKNETK